MTLAIPSPNPDGMWGADRAQREQVGRSESESESESGEWDSQTESEDEGFSVSGSDDEGVEVAR